MSDFDLNAFLAAQSAEGTSQGEGDFTISHEKASQKMSQYSLPREHAWVLKLVQSAVGWNCSKLTLTQTRTISTFTFQLEECDHLPTNQALVSAILKADLESHAPTESLATALRVLVEKAHLSFLLLIDRGTPDPQAIYAGVYFAEMDETKRTRHRAGWGKGVTLAINHIAHTETNRLLLNYIPLRRHGLPMLMELERYAYVSPVPTFVDGRRVDGVLRSSALKWSYHKKPLRLSGMEIPGDEEPPFRVCSDLQNLVLDVDTTLEQALERLDVPREAEAYFVLGIEVPKVPYEAQRMILRSNICWVRNGVIAEEQPLPVAQRFLSLHIYVSAEGLGSDLTGFALVRNEELKRRQKRILTRMAEVLELELRADRQIRPQEPESEEEEEKEDEEEEVVGEPEKKTIPELVAGVISRLEDVFAPGVDWVQEDAQNHYSKELGELATELRLYISRLDEPPTKARPRKVPAQAESAPSKPDLPPVKEKFQWTPPEER